VARKLSSSTAACAVTDGAGDAAWSVEPTARMLRRQKTQIQSFFMTGILLKVDGGLAAAFASAW
jgi:hypothetical protein